MSTPTWQIGAGGKRAPKRPGKLNQVRSSGTLTRFAAAPTDAAEVPNSVGTISGYASVTGVWTQISDRSGVFMEQISPGAFRDVNPADVILMFGHGKDPFLGERPIATLDSLVEDDAGLAYRGQLLPTLGVLEILPALSANLFGSSFKFAVHEDRYDPHPQRSQHNPDALPERLVDLVEIFEISPVVYPAYRSATATAVPAADTLLLSGNSTGSIAASREPRRTTRPSWQLPAAKPHKPYSFTKEN